MKLIWKVVGFYNSEPVVEFNCKTRKEARAVKAVCKIYDKVELYRVVEIDSIAAKRQVYKKVY